MKTSERVIRAQIDKLVAAPMGEVLTKLAGAGGVYASADVRAKAEKAINEMSNFELLQLLDTLSESAA